MAANLMPIQPSLIIRASSSGASTSGSHKSDAPRKSWWTPLFGWSSEPDYIDSINSDKMKANNKKSFSHTSRDNSESDVDQKSLKSRVSSSNFTDEKARKLRMLTKETESFHDAMYHSAIASRLASDFSDRSDL
ncbi:uncharacterized protein LOC143588734 [Bidens hawaiensis]|uniref:uncharacterized protein LOC143588734 n=1 Tax=Bidens hawaiensis TaxID=980011 RepID=UPI004049E490